MTIEPRIREVQRDRVVIFLDVLGFRDACSEASWRTAYGTKNVQEMYQFWLAKIGPELDAVAGGVWESKFILSDSLFLTSRDLDRALRSLIQVFSSDFYHGQMFGIGGMVRGGIGYGDLIYDTGIPDSPGPGSGAIANLYGPAVLQAIDHERCGKGPRLFCPKKVPEKVGKPELRSLIVRAPGSQHECFEIMWGADITSESMDNVESVRAVFRAAWRGYEEKSGLCAQHRQHYLEGLCFAIRCMSHYCRISRNSPPAGFEGELKTLILPSIQRMQIQEDWSRVDEVIRWEVAKQEGAKQD